MHCYLSTRLSILFPSLNESSVVFSSMVFVINMLYILKILFGNFPFWSHCLQYPISIYGYHHCDWGVLLGVYISVYFLGNQKCGGILLPAHFRYRIFTTMMYLPVFLFIGVLSCLSDSDTYFVVMLIFPKVHLFLLLFSPIKCFFFLTKFCSWEFLFIVFSHLLLYPPKWSNLFHCLFELLDLLSITVLNSISERCYKRLVRIE